MRSICNFIPAKNVADELKTVHFVYETEFEKMKQPFIYPIYYMHLVTRGEGKLSIGEAEFSLRQGSLYFAFPGVPYSVSGSDDFAYMYISFMGVKARELISSMKISAAKPTYEVPAELTSFWWRSVQRINPKNANVLTESVLLNTLSYISDDSDEYKSKLDGVIDNIISYVDNNYTDTTLSLKKIADIFAYTDKYLSRLFKENMKINFNQYITRLRIRHALELIQNGAVNVNSISQACGYSDPLYFAKVFKKLVQVTPHEYVKSANQGILRKLKIES